MFFQIELPDAESSRKTDSWITIYALSILSSTADIQSKAKQFFAVKMTFTSFRYNPPFFTPFWAADQKLILILYSTIKLISDFNPHEIISYILTKILF